MSKRPYAFLVESKGVQLYLGTNEELASYVAEHILGDSDAYEGLYRVADRPANTDTSEPEISPIFCTSCTKDTSKHYFTCDIEMDREWCPDCFNDSPCGRGHHGEGCMTAVYEIGEAPNGEDQITGQD